MNEYKSSMGLFRAAPKMTLGKSTRRDEIRRRTPAGPERSNPAGTAARESAEVPEIDRKVGQTIAYMLQHLNQHLEVATLAALVNISPSHFFALFKRRTGCAPIDFFIRLRMQHACQLLEGTSLNVKEVAGVLGYDDPFYFSRTFKAVNHVAPSEYRMMPREMKDVVRNAALPPALLGTSASNVTWGPGFAVSARDRLLAGPGLGSGSPPGAEGNGPAAPNDRILHDRQNFTGSRKDSCCHVKSNSSDAAKS